MFKKFIQVFLGSATLSGIVLMFKLPVQAQLPITSGTLGGSLNYVGGPDYSLVSININAINLILSSGSSLTNFDGGAILKGFQGGPTINGLLTIGSSGSVSGVITGRSLTTSGLFLVFNQTPITIQGSVASGSNTYGAGTATQTGIIQVTGGLIETNPSNALLAKTGPNASDLANDPNFQRRFQYVKVGSSGTVRIGGPPSRIFADPILIEGIPAVSEEVVIIGTKNDDAIDNLKNEEKNLQAKRDEAVKKEAAEEAERKRQKALAEEAERKRQQAFAALQSQRQDLQLRLQQLFGYRDSASNQKATLEEFTNSLRVRQDNKKDEILDLQAQVKNLNQTKTAYQEDLSRLQERENKLVELINSIANDKTMEAELNSLQDEVKGFAKKIDATQDALVKIINWRKAIQSIVSKRSISFTLETLAAKTIPKALGVDAGVSVSPTGDKTFKIEYKPLKKLADFLNTNFQASDIADWYTGASVAIAEAKLNASEQKATAVQNLGNQLKSTRASIKQSQSEISNLDTKIEQVNTQITSTQTQLGETQTEVQKYQAQLNEANSQLSQIEVQIQQTQAAIEQNQRQINNPTPK